MPRNTRTTEPRQTRAQREAEAQEHARNAERHRVLGSRCEGKALEHYAEAGKELIRVKELSCGHGQFKRWLMGNFYASVDTAQDYMSIARCWPRFADAGSIRECVRLTRDYERHGGGRTVAENRFHRLEVSGNFKKSIRKVEVHFARTVRATLIDPFGFSAGGSEPQLDAAVFIQTDPIGQRGWATVEAATKQYIDQQLVPPLKQFLEDQIRQHILPAYIQWRERELAEQQPTLPEPDQPVPVEPPQPADELPETEQPVPGQPQPRPPVQRRRITRVPDAQLMSRSVSG